MSAFSARSARASSQRTIGLITCHAFHTIASPGSDWRLEGTKPVTRARFTTVERMSSGGGRLAQRRRQDLLRVQQFVQHLDFHRRERLADRRRGPLARQAVLDARRLAQPPVQQLRAALEHLEVFVDQPAPLVAGHRAQGVLRRGLPVARQQQPGRVRLRGLPTQQGEDIPLAVADRDHARARAGPAQLDGLLEAFQPALPIRLLAAGEGLELLQARPRAQPEHPQHPPSASASPACTSRPSLPCDLPPSGPSPTVQFSSPL